MGFLDTLKNVFTAPSDDEIIRARERFLGSSPTAGDVVDSLKQVPKAIMDIATRDEDDLVAKGYKTITGASEWIPIAVGVLGFAVVIKLFFGR